VRALFHRAVVFQWVAPATILYLAHRLVLDSKHDETTKKLLHTFTFVLIPTINPDGYVYVSSEGGCGCKGVGWGD
jgi:murein tripeptide amidase MpaA